MAVQRQLVLVYTVHFEDSLNMSYIRGLSGITDASVAQNTSGVDVVSAYTVVPTPNDPYANITADYGVLGIGPASGTVTTPFNNGAYTDGDPDDTQVIADNRSGVYSGSLSAQGGMVAMQLNQGSYKYQPVPTGSRRWRSWVFGGVDTEQPTEEIPYLTGYLRQYWRDPTTCTFGNDSAIPAITGVVPASFPSMPGNLMYYIDLQMTRVSGSNYFNINTFISTFNQTLGWLSTTNNYVAATNNAKNTNLGYYGATDYKSFVSQGFDVYKQGKALVTALRNQGITTRLLSEGHFGTPNAVVKTLVTNGLGYINNLSSVMVANGVNMDQIYDEAYTTLCIAQLEAITNPDDLKVIQGVLDSSIPNITNAMAYCSIEQSSGLSNDSAFKTLTEFGIDIVDRAPGLSFADGAALATLITNIQTEVSSSVESLATNESLLPQSVLDALRLNLPTNGQNAPVSMLNVMGLASGYLSGYMAKVNNGIAALYATSYGPRIRAVLTDISRYDARVALSAAEVKDAEKFVIVPPPVYGSQTTFDQVTGIMSTVEVLVDRGGPDYWETNRNKKIDEYYSILNEVANDNSENIKIIFNTINDNYNEFCRLLSYEYQNFARASSTFQTYADNSQIFTFVSSLPGHTADTQNLGTDTILYGMAQPNSAGDLVKAAMANAKNNQILGEVGVRIKGQI